VFAVFDAVPDPFNYITFFGLRKHEEMAGKLVCMSLGDIHLSYLSKKNYKNTNGSN